MDVPIAPPSVVKYRRLGSRGFTFLELVIVVSLLGLALAEGLPAARHLRDRMSAVGARESLVGIFHQARMEAVARGGSTVLLRASPPEVELWAGGVLRTKSDLLQDHSVSMVLSGGREAAEIALDALGVGRVASQTIRLTRNGVECGLVVSSLGRVTRR